MPTPEGQIVALALVTGDDGLADRFASELDELGAENPLTRLATFQAAITHLESLAEPARASQIMILDLRDAQREGIRFLNEVHNRYPFAEPVTFIIGAGEFEAEILSGHDRYIAAQLPDEGAGTAFVEWAASMLSDNWSFEELPPRC